MDDAGTMGLTEYNAETSAGAGFNDALAASFIDLPIMRRFSREWEVQPLLARHGVMHTLLDSWEDFPAAAPGPGSRSWTGPTSHPQ
jgi:hypothetical protein